MASSSSSVKVALRIRPLSAKEALENNAECVACLPDQPEVLLGADRSFVYDHVFDQDSPQGLVYTESVSPLVNRFLSGYNATILAYGQTGSGKTFSMGTGLDVGEPGNEGIVPRAVHDLFARLDRMVEEAIDAAYEVRVTFLELYNDEVIDLLSPRRAAGEKKPEIREDGKGGVTWTGVKQLVAKGPGELFELLTKGSMCRTTGSTDMNLTSSRSHAVFSIQLTQRLPVDMDFSDEGAARSLAAEDKRREEAGEGPVPEDGGESEDISTSAAQPDATVPTTARKGPAPPMRTVVSKFHFVDLAGSERLKKTNATGSRKKEGIAINAGLLALGNVISALCDQSTRKPGSKEVHIPYRDSKLTRLLQDSLGGNSQTMMLACISPADANFSETLSTLRYATRARRIQNRARVNVEDPAATAAEVKRLRQQLARLQTELVSLKEGTLHGPSSLSLSPSGESADPGDASVPDDGRRKWLEAQLFKCRYESKRLKVRVNELAGECEEAKAERDSLRFEVLGLQEEGKGKGKRRRGEGEGEGEGDSSFLTEGDEGDSDEEEEEEVHPLILQYVRQIGQLELRIREREDELLWYKERDDVEGQYWGEEWDGDDPDAGGIPRGDPPLEGERGRDRSLRLPDLVLERQKVNDLKTHLSPIQDTLDKCALIPDSPPRPSADDHGDDDDDDGFDLLDDDLDEEERHRRREASLAWNTSTSTSRSGGVRDVLDGAIHEGRSDDHPESIDALLASLDMTLLGDKEAEEAAEEERERRERRRRDLEEEGGEDKPTDGPSHPQVHGREMAKYLTDMLEQINESIVMKEGLMDQIEHLHATILLKEDLVSELEETRADQADMMRRYEEKVALLSNAVRGANEERDLALHRLDEAQAKASGSGSGPKDKMTAEVKQQYEGKMRALVAEIGGLRREGTAAERKAETTQRQNHFLIRNMRAAVEQLRAEKGRMVARAKEEADRAREAGVASQKEIQALRRKERGALEEAQRLQRAHDMQRLVLKRQTEEILQLGAKLKVARTAMGPKAAAAVAAATPRSPTSPRVSLDLGHGPRALEALREDRRGDTASVGGGGRGRRRPAPHGSRGSTRSEYGGGGVHRPTESSSSRHARAQSSSSTSRHGVRRRSSTLTVDTRLSQSGDGPEGGAGGDGSGAQSASGIRVTFKRQMLERELAVCVAKRQVTHVLEDLMAKREGLREERHALALAKASRKGSATATEVSADGTPLPSSSATTTTTTMYDDPIELLDAELSFLDARIRGLKLEASQMRLTERGPGLLGRDVGYDNAMSMVGALGVTEARRLLQWAVDEVVRLRVGDWARGLERAELERGIMDLRRTLLVMRKTAVTAAAEYERRLRDAEGLRRGPRGRGRAQTAIGAVPGSRKRDSLIFPPMAGVPGGPVGTADSVFGDDEVEEGKRGRGAGVEGGGHSRSRSSSSILSTTSSFPYPSVPVHMSRALHGEEASLYGRDQGPGSAYGQDDRTEYGDGDGYGYGYGQDEDQDQDGDHDQGMGSHSDEEVPKSIYERIYERGILDLAVRTSITEAEAVAAAAKTAATLIGMSTSPPSSSSHGRSHSHSHSRGSSRHGSMSGAIPPPPPSSVSMSPSASATTAAAAAAAATGGGRPGSQAGHRMSLCRSDSMLYEQAASIATITSPPPPPSPGATSTVGFALSGGAERATRRASQMAALMKLEGGGGGGGGATGSPSRITEDVPWGGRESPFASARRRTLGGDGSTIAPTLPGMSGSGSGSVSGSIISPTVTSHPRPRPLSLRMGATGPVPSSPSTSIISMDIRDWWGEEADAAARMILEENAPLSPNSPRSPVLSSNRPTSIPMGQKANRRSSSFGNWAKGY